MNCRPLTLDDIAAAPNWLDQGDLRPDRWRDQTTRAAAGWEGTELVAVGRIFTSPVHTGPLLDRGRRRTTPAAPRVRPSAGRPPGWSAIRAEAPLHPRVRHFRHRPVRPPPGRPALPDLAATTGRHRCSRPPTHRWAGHSARVGLRARRATPSLGRHLRLGPRQLVTGRTRVRRSAAGRLRRRRRPDPHPGRRHSLLLAARLAG